MLSYNSSDEEDDRDQSTEPEKEPIESLVYSKLNELRNNLSFQKLLNLQLKVEGDEKVIFADANFASAYSEYIKLAIQYQIQSAGTETDIFPIKLTLPNMNFHTLDRIINAMYGEDFSYMEEDDDQVLKDLEACDFLLIQRSFLRLDRYVSEYLKLRAHLVNDSFLSKILSYFQAWNNACEMALTREALVNYFSCFKEKHSLIFDLDDTTICNMFKKSTFLFLTVDELKSKSFGTAMPFYTGYKAKFEEFLRMIPSERNTLKESLKDMFDAGEILTAIPGRLKRWYSLSIGRHNDNFADFSRTDNTNISSWGDLTFVDWQLSAITFYYTHWGNAALSHVAGFKTEYRNVKDGKIVEIIPFDFAAHHTDIASERCELSPDEFIVDARANAGFIIDNMVFWTNKGRELGPFGTSTGGNVYETSNMSALKRPHALFGFQYDVIMSLSKPMVNNVTMHVVLPGDRECIKRSLKNISVMENIVKSSK